MSLGCSCEKQEFNSDVFIGNFMNMPIYIWYSGDLNIGGVIKWFLLSCIDKQFKIMEYYTVY